jgi:hypothetical protein
MTQGYYTDLTQNQWKFLEPLIPAPKPRTGFYAKGDEPISLDIESDQAVGQLGWIRSSA